jgi:hypothetical protein
VHALESIAGGFHGRTVASIAVVTGHAPPPPPLLPLLLLLLLLLVLPLLDDDEVDELDELECPLLPDDDDDVDDDDVDDELLLLAPPSPGSSPITFPEHPNVTSADPPTTNAPTIPIVRFMCHPIATDVPRLFLRAIVRSPRADHDAGGRVAQGQGSACPRQ